MKELLTEREIHILRTYANLNMRLKPTADTLHYNPRTIFGIFANIYARTGLNPREFWDLVNILQTIAKEELNGR